MRDIPALNQVLDHLQQLQAAVSGIPLRDQIVHLPQLQKASDEIELRKRVLERLRQAQVILRQAGGPDAWRWILQSLREEVNTFGTSFGSLFYGPPPLPVSLPDLEAAERARAELEAWAQEAPVSIPLIPFPVASGLGDDVPARPAQQTDGVLPVVETHSTPYQTRAAANETVLLPDHINILKVLHTAGVALTASKIAVELLRLHLEQRRAGKGEPIDAISVRIVETRIKNLIADGLVAKPKGTSRKGVAITEKGRQKLIARP
jgi:hypothetical protein